MKRGFTLLELLIVIAIIAVISAVLIFILNPAEILKKSRDSQRFSDLATLKTALGVFVNTKTGSALDLDAAIANHCLATGPNTAAVISYSAEVADAACTPNVVEGGDVTASSTFSTTDFCRYVGTTGAASTDGTGWVPVNLGAIAGGSPLQSLPLDPTNTVATSTAPTSADLVYRYACQHATAGGKPTYVFELNATLESDAYTIDEDRRKKDGGDNDNYFEVGSSVKLMGTGTNF